MPAVKYPLFLNELARRLKTAREERHLTQQEVYDATGVHVGRLEVGHRDPALSTIAVLCQHYGVSLAAMVADLDQHIKRQSQP
ncbi:helix-turn-helix domain-containing protein [Hymenobacter convexus]|uniref:helix-turn-helix domain-containing protein n=1 Tax=Hymenobacter sp. CA1UV-4 TaxID=3063782 RepID=UPI00350FA72B